MKTKTLLSSLLVSSLLLTACSNEAPKKEEDTKKTETKQEVKKDDKANKAKEKIKKQKEDKKEDVTTETQTTEEKTQETTQTTEAATQEQQQAINVNNITNRSQLEAVIYGNYSEVDKITAYNNAVSNGVIPQGNVMEGPASKAYESSLRVESGQEKSAYVTNPNPGNAAAAKYDDLYNSSNATDDIDPNFTPGNVNNDAPTGLTSGEIQTKYAIEQGYYDGPNAQEVYNAIIEKEQALQNQ